MYMVQLFSGLMTASRRRTGGADGRANSLRVIITLRGGLTPTRLVHHDNSN